MLILGGTSEANALARRLADEPGVEAVLSLAGATANPAPAPIPQRVGGFGGPEGLAAYLGVERIDVVIDATHPFSARMSANAFLACRASGVPLVAFTRPAWARRDADRWTEVVTMDEAVDVLGPIRRVVFLTHGRLDLAAFARAPHHRYIVRAIDPPAEVDLLPDRRLILKRGPFALDAELALMRDEKVEILVTKNSGGGATYPKIEAARSLGVKVIMLRRPEPPEAQTLERIDEVMAWIVSHHAPP